MTLPQLQQQARERFNELRRISSFQTMPWCEQFIDDILADFLLEIEKEVVPKEVPDPGDFGGEDDKLIREQWWGSELTRRHVFNAFKRLRGN